MADWMKRHLLVTHNKTACGKKWRDHTSQLFTAPIDRVNCQSCLNASDATLAQAAAYEAAKVEAE